MEKVLPYSLIYIQLFYTFFLMQILVCSLPKREENIPPIYMLRLLFLVVL